MGRPIGLIKTGGRAKGTPNKRSGLFLMKLEELNLDLLEEICKTLPELIPERRIQALTALLPYCYPKSQGEVEGTHAINPISEMSDEEIDSRLKHLNSSIF